MKIRNSIKSALVKNYRIKIVAYLGLLISCTALLFGISFYRTETSFDTFHANANRLYRLNLKSENGLEDAEIVRLSREKILNNIPELEDIVRLKKLDRPAIICEDQVYNNENIIAADSSFFKVFSFPLKRGNYDALYEKPNSIILTSDFATKLYGNDDVIGKTLKLTTTDISIAELYTVSGIVQNLPSNSHITAEAIILIKPNTPLFFAYFLLNKNVKPQEVERKLDGIYKKPNIAILQNIKDIHLHSNKIRELKNNGSISSLRIVVISCLLLFIISICNYIIINWISYIKNMKTIQFKRIVGAKFSMLIVDEIISQIIVIIPIIVISALIFSIINHVSIFTNKRSLFDLIILTISFASATIIAACIPFSRLYYKLRKTNIIRQTNSSAIPALAIFQIAIAMGLIATSILVSRQMNFIYKNQIGGTETNLLVLKGLTWDEMKIYEQLKQELPKHSCVLGICSTSETPGTGIKDHGSLLTNGKDSVYLFGLSADHNFAEFFNIPLIAGNYLPEYNYSKRWEEDHFDPRKATGPSSGIDYFLVNKKAVDLLGIKNPNDILGMSVKSELFAEGKIVGVVDDFHFSSVYEKDVPLIIKQRSWIPSTVIIRYQKSQEKAVIELIKKQWNQQIPNCTPKYSFMSDIYGNIYHNERRTFNIILIISTLSILISILGLISITAYTTTQRTKEIGIRKVNGAKVIEILATLNDNFIKWIFIAFIIATPLVWYAMNQWLQNFAYRIELSWWVFVMSFLFVLGIAILTVSWQSWKAATRNPVEALRYE